MVNFESGQGFSHVQIHPQEFNATFITLIPKEKEAIIVDKFRPTSLYNIIYNIITKLIAYRPKPILSIIISQE